MAQAEQPERLRPDRQVTVDDVRQLMGGSTPHFALQLRTRIRRLLLAPAPPLIEARQTLGPLEGVAARLAGFELDDVENLGGVVDDQVVKAQHDACASVRRSRSRVLCDGPRVR